MKLQNPSFIFFSTDRRTDRQAETNMLPTFSKLGHKNNSLVSQFYLPSATGAAGIPKSDVSVVVLGVV